MGGQSLSFGKDFERLVEQSSRMAALLWNKGWAEKNAGNLSVNVTEHVPVEVPLGLFQFIETPVEGEELAGESFLVTASGARFRDVADNPVRWLGVARVSKKLDGYHLLWGGKESDHFRPTSELPAHLRVHRLLKQKGASRTTLLHTHPDELIALSHLKEYQDEKVLNRALWAMLPEVRMYVPSGLGYVPYHLPGSKALAEATVGHFERNRTAVLWEKHGALALGKNPLDAFDTLDVLNKAATVRLKCLMAGKEPEGLTEAQLAELERAFPPPENL